MAHPQVLIRADDAEFFVEVVDSDGPRTISADRAMSFDAVHDALAAIGSRVVRALDAAAPDEASVEFGLSFTAKSGKLSALLVESGGEASLKVSMTWKRTAAPAAGHAGL